MGRYKVKVWQGSDGSWNASLYEDPVNMPLQWTGIQCVGKTREQVMKDVHNEHAWLIGAELAGEPEWVTLDDEVPEPQSLKPV